MPLIPDEILNCSVYVYPTLVAAQNGEDVGASGFLCGVQYEVNKEWFQTYVVTNKHVIKSDKQFIRLNKIVGGSEIFPIDKKQWVFHPDGDDIAVFPFDPPQTVVKFSFVNAEHFVTQSTMPTLRMGTGDDVFMVGRFISHEGKQRNTPTVRFGNISMMPLETIRHPTLGIEQESFLVECRSIPGYSGSPVFVYKGALSWVPQRFSGGLTTMMPQSPWLLGVDWCHLNNEELVRDCDGKPITGGLRVRSNTGMAAVVPAWRLLDILNGAKLEAQRKKDDEHVTKQKNASKIGLD